MKNLITCEKIIYLGEKYFSTKRDYDIIMIRVVKLFVILRRMKN